MDDLRFRGRGDSDRLGKVAWAFGLGHHGIRQKNAEGLLEPHEQLDSLEAADAEIAIKYTFRCDGSTERGSAKFGNELLDDGEYSMLDLIVSGRLDRRGIHLSLIDNRASRFYWRWGVSTHHATAFCGAVQARVWTTTSKGT